MIESMLHKHRYFGHSGEIYESCPWSVTTVTPMKRGLKDLCECIFGGFRFECGYNRYPDEKGTESRGTSDGTGESRGCYNRYPDEKGTERRNVIRST